MPDDQLDVFEAHTRHTDPETSHEAAARVNENISEACTAVWSTMKLLGPACDEDLQMFYDRIRVEHGWPPQRCVRKRRKDLVDAGKARFTGKKVVNPVGLNVREWEAC